MLKRAQTYSSNAKPVTHSAPVRKIRLVQSLTVSTAALLAPFQTLHISEPNKNSGIVWNEASFKEYIKDPRAKVPGTKMIFPGVKNEQQVNDLWAYIKQFDASGNIKK